MVPLFGKLIQDLRGSEKIMIYHDTDMDGIGSAILLNKYLSYKGVVDTYLIPHGEGPRKVNTYMIEHIEKIKPSKMFILDLAFDEDLENLREINKKYNMEYIAIIDHHKMNENIEKYEKENIYVIKPQRFTSIPPEKYPTSKLVYDLVKTYWSDIKKWWWISALGIIGDAAYSQWEQSFFKEHLKNSKIKLEDLFLGEELVSFALTSSKDSIFEVMNILDNAESVKEVIEKLQPYEKIREEIDKLVREHKTKGQIYDDIKLLVYEVKNTSLRGIRSRVANILSQKYYPDYTVIVYGINEDNHDQYLISFRNTYSKVDVAKMIKDLKPYLTTLDGGGHKPAAGASINKEEMEKFLELVKRYLKDHKNI